MAFVVDCKMFIPLLAFIVYSLDRLNEGHNLIKPYHNSLQSQFVA